MLPFDSFYQQCACFRQRKKISLANRFFEENLRENGSLLTQVEKEKSIANLLRSNHVGTSSQSRLIFQKRAIN